MKRIHMAIGTAALGLATMGTALFAQSPTARPGYSLYGGPESRSEVPEQHGVRTPTLSPIYKMYGVPDEIAIEDAAREARRNAAVEFGMYRRQFTGSTEFWIDYDRTRLAKVRYAMDEPMWLSIHPSYDWGDGGYMYNTAASVGGPQLPGSILIVTPPEPAPVVRTSVVRSNNPAPNRTTSPSDRTLAPADRATHKVRPLVASEADDSPVDVQR